MLRIEIIGNLGSDPEQRFTQEGKAQVSIRVAVNSRRRGLDGEQVERTDWFRARVMGAMADYVAGFHKGQRVLVIGRLEIGEWTTREGEPGTSYDTGRASGGRAQRAYQPPGPPWHGPGWGLVKNSGDCSPRILARRAERLLPHHAEQVEASMRLPLMCGAHLALVTKAENTRRRHQRGEWGRIGEQRTT